MKKNLITFLFFFLGVVFPLEAQYAEFKHISTDDGLASSEVYCHLQDSLGYMWFGTSRGLSRYDGYEFKNYTASDGLPSNSIIRMFYDRFGRIWFATYDGLLSYFEDGEIKLFEYNDTLAYLSKNYYILDVFVDENKSVWVMPALGGIYEFTKGGEIFDRKPDKKVRSFFFKDIGKGAVYSYIGGDESDTTYLEVNENEHTILGVNKGFRKNFIKIRNGEYLLSIGSTLYYIRNNHIVNTKKYSNDISGLFCDNNKNFWISVMYEGVYYYASSDLNSLPEIYLAGMSPIAVFQDHQNGYWLSTTENGVYYSPSFQFISYKRFGIPLFNILSLHISNNVLYFSTFDRQVVKCNLNKHRIMSIENLLLLPGRDYAIQDITSTSDSSVWFLGKELIKAKNNEYTRIDGLSRSYKLVGKGNKVYVSSSEGVNIYSDTLCQTIKVDNFPTSNAIFIDDARKVWVGTITGLYCFSGDEVEFLGDKNDLLKSRINDIKTFDKYIVIATNGNGIFFYNPKTNYLKIIDEKAGLNSNFVNTLFSDESDVWAGTNKGLCKINIIDNYDSVQYFLTKFTDIDGLYASEIKDIDKIDNCIFLGTTQGLISFYPKDLTKNMIPPELHFDSILVNNIRVEIDTQYQFLPDENTVSFFFKGISFSAGSKVIYRYKLIGYDDKWEKTANRFLRFPNLQPGEYTLHISSSADGVVWNAEPLKVNFKVKNKFTNSFVFYFLLLLLFIALAFVGLSIRFSALHKDLKLKRRMMRAEQKALRSQMNPHFLFNALNSIRRYILENDSDNADFYLTSFATLMRKVLDNSKREFISLEEEISTLKLYLELEKMRFDDSFTFQIEIEEDLSLGIFTVPPMIIQPILENAIWHGLAPLQRDGLLKLSFKTNSEKALICVIEDNGIGREKAAEIAIRRKGHKSTGVKNLQERLNLLNSVGAVDIDYKVLDLFEANGVASGTKVELNFKYLKKTVKKRLSFKIFGRRFYFRLN